MNRRGFLLGFLLATLLVAGVASYYASSDPDGLERVAATAGFADSERESRAADSPFADYETRGVDDERIGGGLAGVAGSLGVLLLAGGLFWVLRRRTPHDADPDEA